MNAAGGHGDRASERDRSRTAARLRRRLRQGRISSDTFAWRLDAAMAARYRHELAALIDDLPPGPLPRAWASVVTACRDAAAEVRARVRRPPRIRLLLPPPGAPPVTIGRSRFCDLWVADDPMVSGHHAELRSHGAGWLLTDLHSTNGTWVNGARLLSSTVVRPGDVLGLGSSTFVLAAPAPVPEVAPPPAPAVPRRRPVPSDAEPVTPRLTVAAWGRALPGPDGG